MTLVLQTQRVSLRKLTEDDADNFFQLDNDENVLRFTSQQPLESVYAYKLKLRETYLPFYDRYENFGFWAAEERASGLFIGWFCLHPAVEAGEAASLLKFGDDDFEIGYRLRRFAWGKNYATEVTRALVTWAFSELGVKSIVATTSSANLASIRVLEKAGLRLVEGLFPLPWADVPYVKFAISRDELS